MNQGRIVFSQLISFLPDREFRRCVERYQGDIRLRGFSCWDQYLAMAFAQLSYRESLRDIEACLRSMQGKLYHLEFRGLGQSKTADMHVQATFTAGSGKSFQVIDESGSHLLLNHVLKKLLETEQNDSREQKAALTPSNYNFEFQTKTSENGRELYVFAVEPKVKNKLLYRGKIWIDAGDYAVIKVDAQPAETPSFWIKKTEIHHVYAKSGEFWLPETNRSESKVRLGGSAVLTIDYGTYQFEKPHESTLTGAAEVASHKPPPDVQ